MLSLANRDPLFHRAVLALHEAAPVELASAPLGPPLAHDVVAPAAAEAGAAVPGGAGLVAPPSRGAGDVDRRVLLAEVGRLLVVIELPRQVPQLPLAAGPAVLLLPLLPARAADPVRGYHGAQVALRDQHGVPEPVLQALADHPKVRDDLPAGLQLARPGHAVALAAHLHVARQRLQLYPVGMISEIGGGNAVLLETFQEFFNFQRTKFYPLQLARKVMV